MFIYSWKKHLINDLTQTMEKAGFSVRGITDEGQLYEELEKNPNSIVLLDTRIVQGDFKKNIGDLVSAFPEARIFALSQTPFFAEGTTLLNHGVKGYANLYLSPVLLKQAIEEIEAGKIWLYPEFIQEMIHSFSNENKQSASLHKLEELTQKQKEVAHLVARGLSNKEISNELKIKETTVKTHLKTIYAKLEITDRLSLALLLK